MYIYIYILESSGRAARGLDSTREADGAKCAVWELPTTHQLTHPPTTRPPTLPPTHPPVGHWRENKL